MNVPRYDTTDFAKVVGQLVGSRMIWASSEGRFRFVKVFTEYEDSLNKHDYSFFIYCPWRITSRLVLVYGSADSSSASTYLQRPEIRSGIRERMLRFIEFMENGMLVVKQVQLRNRYDLWISFEHGYRLCTFSDSNRNEELWAFYDKVNDTAWAFTVEDGFVPHEEMSLPPNDTGVRPYTDIAGR